MRFLIEGARDGDFVNCIFDWGWDIVEEEGYLANSNLSVSLYFSTEYKMKRGKLG